MKRIALLVSILGACVAEPTETDVTSALCSNGEDCGGGTTTTIPHYDWYCGIPEIRYSTITNAHECDGSSIFGCGRAFMYFDEAGTTEKTGTLPKTIGTQTAGIDLYNTNVWASNFQGPYVVNDTREQFEWGTSGSTADDTSQRVYPALYAVSCAAVPVGGALATAANKSLHVYEDDEFVNPDDYVGAMTFGYSACTTDVFNKGLNQGWTSPRAASVSGDVGAVSYREWCWKCSDTTGCGVHSAPGITF